MSRRTRTERRRGAEVPSLMDPFTRGEPIETLFYIPPAGKGSVDEGIAGGRPVKIKISILSPRRKGSIETTNREVPS